MFASESKSETQPALPGRPLLGAAEVKGFGDLGFRTEDQLTLIMPDNSTLYAPSIQSTQRTFTHIILQKSFQQPCGRGVTPAPCADEVQSDLYSHTASQWSSHSKWG